VQQSGGSIAIDSQVGHGTRVTILLPRSTEIIAAEPAGRAGTQKPSRAATILVVEDDAEVRKTSMAMLSDLGHHVLIARDGPEALALVRAGNPIDILFTDVAMPGGMSGIELARQAIALRPTMKILITTGYQGHPELLHNEFSVLPKPFTRLDLELLIPTLAEQSFASESDVPAA